MAGQLSKSCEISEEFDLDDFTNDVEKVILLQAVFRGCLVRKCLADVRREFDVIARETDPQNGNFSVEWKGPNICLPTYKKNRKKTQKNVEETTFKNRIDCDAEPHPRAELAKETSGTSECKISTANVNQNACCCHCSVPHVHTNGSQDGVENNASDTNFTKNKNSGTDKTDIGDTDSGSHCDIKGNKEFSCVTDDNSALLTSLGNPEVMDHHNNDIEFSETASLLSVVKSLGDKTDRQDEKNKHQAELEAEAKVAGAGKEGVTLMQRGQNSNTHNLSEDKGGYSNSKRQPERPLIDVLEPQPETSLHHTDSTLPQQDSTLHLSDRSLRVEPESTLTLLDSSPQMPTSTPPPQDSTLQLADSTCLWEDSTMAQPQTPHSNNTTDLSWSRDPEALREKRQHIAMELLWVQQAILSRKNYLRLKQQMKSPVV